MDFFDINPQERGAFRRQCLCGFIAFIICLTLCLITGCRTTHEATEVRDSVRITDSLRIKDSLRIENKVVIKDSVHIKDSTVVILDSVGNVKQIKEYHIEKVHHTEKDSTAYYKCLFNEAIHELVKAREEKKEVKVEVPKPLPSWKKFLMWSGVAFWLMVFIMLLLCIPDLRRKMF